MKHTVTVYLIDGKPTGTRTYTLDNTNCQAIVVPRVRVNEMLSRSEFQQCALYILLGEKDQEPAAYIGQTKAFSSRVKNHFSKSFWNTALVFTGQKHDSIDEADIRYFEAKAYDVAKMSKRYNLDENTQTPSYPHLSEPKQASDENFFEHISLLASLIGCNIFEEIKEESTSDSPTFYLKSKGIVARAKYGDDGMTVLEGSEIAPTSVPSLKNKESRDKAVHDFTTEVNGKRILSLNRTFSSPSAAAIFCLGRNENGTTWWKDENGKTFKEYYPE